MQVYISDLALTKEEEYILIRMLVKRYNTGRREIKLTSERFPNRIENKRYLVYLLENLVAEAKKLAIIQCEMLQADDKASAPVADEVPQEIIEISQENTATVI